MAKNFRKVAVKAAKKAGKILMAYYAWLIDSETILATNGLVHEEIVNNLKR